MGCGSSAGRGVAPREPQYDAGPKKARVVVLGDRVRGAEPVYKGNATEADAARREAFAQQRKQHYAGTATPR